MNKARAARPQPAPDPAGRDAAAGAPPVGRDPGAGDPGAGERAVGDVGYALKRAQHALRLSMDAALAPLDLTTPQYVVLSVLERAAHAGEDALSGAELARRCFVTPQTMTGLVAGLEGRALVRRRAHPTHGRVLEVGMTGAGRATLRRAHAAAGAVEDRMVAGRTAAERRQLAGWLRDCAAALDGTPGA